jgi:hypothetical protein
MASLSRPARSARKAHSPFARRPPSTLELLEGRDCPSSLTLHLNRAAARRATPSGDLTMPHDMGPASCDCTDVWGQSAKTAWTHVY